MSNLTIECSRIYYHVIKPNYVKARLPNVKKVIYYMCPWHFHELPNKDEFAAEGIICEIVTLPHFDNDKLIEMLQATASEHTIPTLIIVQKILPFQREAWEVKK